MSILEHERQTLLLLARKAVESQVYGRSKPQCDNHSGVLGEKRGCFVTITNRGRLRGCIGTFRPDKPLGEMVIEMGMAAAGHDPRFFGDPITPVELEEITIEVSVLSELELTNDPAGLQVGKHGIYIVSGMNSGCFLPQVATDWGWDAQEFLDQCCVSKAGLQAGAWRKPDTKVYIFTSEKFED